MKLTDVSIRRPVLVSVVFLTVSVLGAVAFKWIPIDLLPEIEVPAITVVTAYPGASATEVEEKVSKVLEDSLGAVAKLNEMTSTSQEGMSIVLLRFDYGTDMSEAANDVRAAIDLRKKLLPEDVVTPQIIKIDMAMFPIIVFTAGSDRADIRYYRDFIDDNVLEPLKRIDGVGSVSVFGGTKYTVQIDVDNSRLTSFGLTLEDVKNIVAARNVSVPAGTLDDGKMDLTVRMLAEVRSTRELEETILSSRGPTVRLRDVATVKLDLDEDTQVTQMNGRTMIAGVVMKMSGANTVAVAEKVKARMAELEKSLPEGMKLYTIMDSSKTIRQSLANLSETLMWAILFVAAVVFLFLFRFVSSMVVLVAMPASLILAFFAMYVAGYSLNVISLMALTIAVGMVVDDAIVVLENITRHVDKGLPAKQAASVGAEEVGLAVSASTLTTVVVFLPLVFISGLVSILFNNLAFVMVLTVMASLFVAVTLTPMMCAKYLKPTSSAARVARKGDELLRGFEIWFGGVVKRALRHRALIVVTGLALCAGTIYLVTKVGFDFMPPSNAGELTATLELPVGTRVEETARIGNEIVKELQAQPAVNYVFMRAGNNKEGQSAAMGSKSGSNIMTIMVRLKPFAERNGTTDSDFMELIRAKIARYPELSRTSVSSGSGMAAMMGGGGKPLTIEVRGDNLERMADAAIKVRDLIASVKGTGDVSAELFEMRPEIAYNVDYEKTSVAGLTAAQLGNTLRTALYGTTISRFRGMGRDDDINLRLQERDRREVTGLAQVRVRAGSGQLVKLGDLGSFGEGTTPLQIVRKDKQRMIAVGASVTGRALGDVYDEVEKKLREAGLYSRTDVSLVAAGNVKEQRTLYSNVGLMLVLALLLVFLVMAAQFESFMDPFVVMFSLPFAFTGAFGLLWLTGTHLSIPALLGLLVLIGVVVKNAIVFVDYTNLMRRKHGMGLEEALITSAERRLRPVLMTSLATVAGLLPMALSKGEGSEMWAPMGRAALGGMLFSTVITLIIVPVMYHIMEFARRKQVAVAPEPSSDAVQA